MFGPKLKFNIHPNFWKRRFERIDIYSNSNSTIEMKMVGVVVLRLRIGRRMMSTHFSPNSIYFADGNYNWRKGDVGIYHCSTQTLSNFYYPTTTTAATLIWFTPTPTLTWFCLFFLFNFEFNYHNVFSYLILFYFIFESNYHNVFSTNILTPIISFAKSWILVSN